MDLPAKYADPGVCLVPQMIGDTFQEAFEGGLVRVGPFQRNEQAALSEESRDASSGPVRAECGDRADVGFGKGGVDAEPGVGSGCGAFHEDGAVGRGGRGPFWWPGGGQWVSP